MPVVEERLFRSIVEAATDAIISTSVDGVIETWNSGAEALFGYSAEEAIGIHVLRLVPRENRREALALLRKVAGGGTVETIDARRLARDGDVRDVSLSAAPMRDGEGPPTGAAIVVRDIASSKALERQLRELTLRDPLTGLYNRRHFEAELDRQITLSKRNGHGGSLLVMDLDNFKVVNDSFGHAVGDEILRGVASVLSQRLRGSDLIARIGGDEFAAILPDVDAGHAVVVARSLEARIRALRGGSGGTISIAASIGVAAYRGDQGEDGALLLDRADGAMYARKREQLLV